MGDARRFKDPRQLAALKAQLEIEEKAAAEKAIAQQAWLDRMPPDLRAIFERGRSAHIIANLIRRGTFQHDTAQQVQNAVQFLTEMGAHHDRMIMAHPAFGEFWPELAAKMAVEARHAAGPVLVGPDGNPLPESAPPAVDVPDVPHPPTGPVVIA